MKKLSEIFLLIITCFFMTACSKGEYRELTYKDLMDKFSKEDSFVLTIEAASCINCDMFKDTITEIANKYNIIVYYIDLDKLSSEEENTLKAMFHYTGTPTTINIVKGTESKSSSRIIGRSDYIKIKEKLINWGYIKE